MKKYLGIALLTILLVACSNVEAQVEVAPALEDELISTPPPSQEMIVDVDTIIAQRDSYKDKQFLTIDEIGEDNLASYLFQQFNQDVCLEIGNCFCHM